MANNARHHATSGSSPRRKPDSLEPVPEEREKGTAAKLLPFPHFNLEASPRARSPLAILLSCLADLVVVVTRSGQVQSLHCPEDYEFLLSAEGIVGKNLEELLPRPQAEVAMAQIRDTLDQMMPHLFASQYRLAGRIREYQVRLAPMGPDAVLAVVRDATARRQFEKEILEANHRIQSRIGQDLHDGLGQHLTGITFLSRALENQLTERGLPEAAQAHEIARLVIQALAQTRQLARSLFPVDLESGGLVSALEELVSSIRTLFKLHCELDCEEDLPLADAHTANHLFRLAQEAVNNAVKHSQAHHLWIQLRRESTHLVLRVLDDGKGLTSERPEMNGLGMRIMRYRANKIGAHLEIHPAPEGGTEVVCRLPLPSESVNPSPVVSSTP